MFTAADREFMRQALELAERGLYTTTPNPRVGCVIVKDGAVVASGWHEKAGLPHAEALALKSAGERAHGATLYLNLEPCSHHGRTPPCADAIVAAGIKRVVAAMQDPNPKVAGAGFAKLRAAGIEVERGLMEDEARELNIGFVARTTRGRPWLRMKIAASLDGRTALANGKSQWITGEAARADGHRWRARACAILTGHGDPARARERRQRGLHVRAPRGRDRPLPPQARQRAGRALTGSRRIAGPLSAATRMVLRCEPVPSQRSKTLR